MKSAWTALTLSISVSAVLTGTAWAFGGLGWDSLARALVWPASLLQGAVPPLNIGTEGQPFYEATPVHVFAFFAGLVAQIPVYWLVFYVVLRTSRRKST